MTFVQPFFLFVLLPLAVAAFYFVGVTGSATLALAVIVAASAVFYAPYGPLPAALLAASLCLNLVVGRLLANPAGRPVWRQQALLAGGLAFNFGALAIFKYLDQIAHLALPSAPAILGVAIPAGISFYTFHQAVFLRDAHRQQPDVVDFLRSGVGWRDRIARFIRYASFVAFFPQLIIGPITYMSEFGPQVRRSGFGRLSWVNLQVGTTLMTVGLFKKLCIADVLAHRIDPVFDAVTAGTPVAQAQAVAAISGFFFQLYFDFSGYSDIALGIARIFGLRLPINFDSPLRATGIVDFYRRWHITLTRVIVVFVFTPLSLWGTRAAMQRRLRGWRLRALSAWLPFLINFQLIALWHAAKYTFVVFGLVHGLWYVVETEIRRTKAFKTYRARTSDRLRAVAGGAVTVIPLVLTFAIFRSDSLSGFARLVAAAAGSGPHPTGAPPVDHSTWAILGAAAVLVYLAPNVYELLRGFRPGIRAFNNPSNTLPALRLAWRPTIAWGLFLAALLAFALLRLGDRAPFLYGAF